MTFDQLNLIPPILTALKEEGYTAPTPIQAQAIPVVLEQRDLLGCAQTGTGKTAAFALPILQLLAKQGSPTKGAKRPIRVLIVTPTRELAIQIGESFSAYGRHLGLSNTVVFGGVGQQAQTNKLRRGVDILIATPGRLLDLMQQGYISLGGIEFFVLDEADRMLDMGFIHDVKKIIAKLPPRRQSLFFSATMPPPIVTLSQKILTNPAMVEVTPTKPAAETVRQWLFYVDRANKVPLLIHALEKIGAQSTLVFARTKHGADKLTRMLKKAGITAEAIHGNKAQNARQKALSNFKQGTTQVLVATDIAARGIDIDELEHVVNYEIPNESETYIHRIGRTGRAGGKGLALSFCDWSEKGYIKDIEKLLGKSIPVVSDHPYPMSDRIPEDEAARMAAKKQPRGPRPQRHQEKTTIRPSNSRYGRKR